MSAPRLAAGRFQPTSPLSRAPPPSSLPPSPLPFLLPPPLLLPPSPLPPPSSLPSPPFPLSLLRRLVLASGASASQSWSPAPKDLHGFLLRADEPAETSFPRTPSFAWNPVPGAIRYQFQLATSSSFRENGIVYSTARADDSRRRPDGDAAVDHGQPARAVRARPRHHGVRDDAVEQGVRLRHGAGPGAEATAELPGPAPLDADRGRRRLPGLVHRHQQPDAEDGDGLHERPRRARVLHLPPHVELDQRVRWRIRALRTDRTDDNKQTRQNGLPAVGYGPWSPVYSSTNPRITAGRSSSASTVSDVVSTGDEALPRTGSCRRSPSRGDQAIDGTSAELFRVYVFTDRQCLNRVFTSAVIGGPAYAPRPFGPARAAGAPRVTPGGTRLVPRDGSEPDSYTLRRAQGSDDRADGVSPRPRRPCRVRLRLQSGHGRVDSRSGPAADSGRQRDPRRAGRPLGHGLAGQRLLLDRHSRRSRLARRAEDEHVAVAADRRARP